MESKTLIMPLICAKKVIFLENLEDTDTSVIARVAMSYRGKSLTPIKSSRKHTLAETAVRVLYGHHIAEAVYVTETGTCYVSVYRITRMKPLNYDNAFVVMSLIATRKEEDTWESYCPTESVKAIKIKFTEVADIVTRKAILRDESPQYVNFEPRIVDYIGHLLSLLVQPLIGG